MAQDWSIYPISLRTPHSIRLTSPTPAAGHGAWRTLRPKRRVGTLVLMANRGRVPGVAPLIGPTYWCCCSAVLYLEDGASRWEGRCAPDPCSACDTGKNPHCSPAEDAIRFGHQHFVGGTQITKNKNKHKKKKQKKKTKTKKTKPKEKHD